MVRGRHAVAIEWLVAALCILTGGESVGAQDVAGMHIRIREMAGRYEQEWRSYAPYLAKSAFPCDEIVGRFCLRYGFGKNAPLHTPPVGLVEARRQYVAQLRSALSVLPHDTLVSPPLTRVLVESGDTRAAMQVALAFAVADTTDAWSYLLLGFALTAENRIAEAERAFGEALPRMSPAERARMLDVRALVGPDERETIDRLEPEAGAGYVAELWRAADPLYLTAGNETRAEHFARYVYARLLEYAPQVTNMPRWGPDLKELTRRFGAPVGTGERRCAYDVRLGRRPTDADRAWITAQTGFDTCEGEIEPISGFYDPFQLTYVAPSFSRERLPPEAEPGATEWFYGPVAKENGFHPRTLRDMRPLEHQLWRIPEGDSTLLRADVELALDHTAPAAAPVELGLFVLDSTLQIIAEARDTVRALGKLARGWVETTLPEGAWAYSVEARETVTGQAARARYELPPPPTGDLEISDPVLVARRAGRPVRSDQSFRPFGSLLLDGHQPLSLYVEASNLQGDSNGKVHYRVELRVAKGRAGGEESSALVWTQEAEASERVPILVDLSRMPVGSGLYRLIVTVRDEISGHSATGQRVLGLH